MIDLDKVQAVVRKIQSHCITMDLLQSKNDEAFSAEVDMIEEKKSAIMETTKSQYDAFLYDHFGSFIQSINGLVDILSEDYFEEYVNAYADKNEFFEASFSDNEKRLHEILVELNLQVEELNGIDFNTQYPPKYIEITGEAFSVYSYDAGTTKYDYSTQERKVEIPKPVSELVRSMFIGCQRALNCLSELQRSFEKEFNLQGFETYVNGMGESWLAEKKAHLESAYSRKFDELFIDESAQAIANDLFPELRKEGEEFAVDYQTGTSSYNEAITIGSVKFLVEDKKSHLNYIEKSPVLKRNLDNGYLTAPLILNLKEKGNIFLQVDEPDYADDTKAFINQIIMQFLVSFPANRINFCLVDIDNKVGFSPYKTLTKINNNILFNGIIRDDRQFDDTIKDLEQAMYKIEDDILSYNYVEDIFEYNSKFEANPQNMHLFVLVNYPSGIKDASVAKRLQKIIQNGNKAGIFTLLIHNETCEKASNFKEEEYSAIMENIRRDSLVIKKTNGVFWLPFDTKNVFEPENNISISKLPEIVDMLAGNAEMTRQIVVPIADIFAYTNEQAKSSKGIAPAEEILDIPIGARGGDIQTLALKTSGDGSAHAVLIGGTGSGKSNLLHTIIMSAAFRYSPDDLNIFLMDLKEGVEFKYYETNRLPHIKLIGTDLKRDLSDAIAILKNLQNEIYKRGEVFRAAGVSQIDQYVKLGNKMPRLLVIIDEIQELIELDEKIGQEAISCMSELFKQGRAFGINILWASQNIPKVSGLKDKVLSQIGNRISLRLNEPDDAMEIKIDPKVVRNLNRPEKGLGVINDIRYGNESVEFRVAFAENTDNRKAYSQQIVDKWKNIKQEKELLIIGTDEIPSPAAKDTLYMNVPKMKEVVSKAFDSYFVQLGQDYVTGKPFSIPFNLRDKANAIYVGYDVEILRDMMGYSMLSVLINHLSNKDYLEQKEVLYYANGEMLNPKNTRDLFNVLRDDFSDVVQNVSALSAFKETIVSLYKVYKKRVSDMQEMQKAIEYAPNFFFIHSMQRYAEMINENAIVSLSDSLEREPEQNPVSTNNAFKGISLSGGLSRRREYYAEGTSNDAVFFGDALKELINKGGEVGIHFIISMDNPLALNNLKNDLSEIKYKVFIKGVNVNMVSQLIGDYKAANGLTNPRVALLAMNDERSKIRLYRYDEETDAQWYEGVRKEMRSIN